LRVTLLKGDKGSLLLERYDGSKEPDRDRNRLATTKRLTGTNRSKIHFADLSWHSPFGGTNRELATGEVVGGNSPKGPTGEVVPLTNWEKGTGKRRQRNR
jgi:hypothetical protein